MKICDHITAIEESSTMLITKGHASKDRPIRRKGWEVGLANPLWPPLAPSFIALA